MMRLDKYLAEAGKGTRSEVKKLISAGKVTVNDTVQKDPGAKVDENADQVSISGEPVRFESFEYYMLNKPKGVISASRDAARGREKQVCVTDLIREKIRGDLFPVGRLDKDTEGLLIITNDGELAHRLLSPKKHIDKTYYAELDGKLDPNVCAELMKGVDIGDEKPTLPCSINIIFENSCLITLQEGRYHEVKRIFKTAGLKVTELKRISMGPLALDTELAPGDYRQLTKEEISLLKNYDGSVSDAEPGRQISLSDLIEIY